MVLLHHSNEKSYIYGIKNEMNKLQDGAKKTSGVKMRERESGKKRNGIGLSE